VTEQESEYHLYDWFLDFLAYQDEHHPASFRNVVLAQAAVFCMPCLLVCAVIRESWGRLWQR
jgi:hypothetical protein